MPIKNDFKKFIQKFQTLQNKLPTIIGGIAVGFAKDNFVKQGFDDNGVTRWKNRKAMPENKRQAREEEERQQDRIKAGKRRTRGRSPKKDKPRSLLVQSGDLKKSIRILKKSTRAVVVGSSLPYSGIHNEGGLIVQTPTEKQKAFFYAKYKETENELWLQMANAKELKINIPKRKFLGKSKTLSLRVQTELKLQISKILNT